MNHEPQDEDRIVAEVFQDGTIRLFDGYTLDELAAIIVDLTRKMEYFLDAIGKRHDPHVLNYIPVAEILADRDTVQAILDKYKTAIFLPPSPPPKRGIVPDGFWDDMARREASGEFKRADTTREYRRLYASHASAYTSKAPLDSYVRQKIHQARKRLGIPPRQKKS